MSEKRIIDVNLLQSLIDYLASRPFREVHQMIGQLMTLPMLIEPAEKPPVKKDEKGKE